jgi:hypothetical protein
MGLPGPRPLEFAGTVGSGLSMAESRELTALLESPEQPDFAVRQPGTSGGCPACAVGPSGTGS